MVADVPLGAFLSGGIDSTIVVGLMAAASDRPVKTFSIGFDDPAFDESRYAEDRRRALRHRASRVRRPAPRRGRRCRPWPRQFDEPFADSSALPTWHVARETRRHVTVALTGDAGDELFGGYDRYRAVALAACLDRLPDGVRSRSRRPPGPRPAGLVAGEDAAPQASAACWKGIGEPARGPLPALGRHVRRARPGPPSTPTPSSTASPTPAPASRPRRRSWPAPSTPPRGATPSPAR